MKVTETKVQCSVRANVNFQSCEFSFGVTVEHGPDDTFDEISERFARELRDKAQTWAEFVAQDLANRAPARNDGRR